jgi:hypothetical protein
MEDEVTLSYKVPHTGRSVPGAIGDRTVGRGHFHERGGGSEVQFSVFAVYACVRGPALGFGRLVS